MRGIRTSLITRINAFYNLFDSASRRSPNEQHLKVLWDGSGANFAQVAQEGSRCTQMRTGLSRVACGGLSGSYGNLKIVSRVQGGQVRWNKRLLIAVNWRQASHQLAVCKRLNE